MTPLATPDPVKPLDDSMTLLEFLRQPYARSSAAGWWTDPETGEPVDPWEIRETKQVLIVSELAEAMEGHRKGQQDDHLPHRPMTEVEYADAFIRSADLAGAFGIEDRHIAQFTQQRDMTLGEYYEQASRPMASEQSFINRTRVSMHDASKYYANEESLRHAMLRLSFNLLLAGKGLGYDMIGAIIEKMEYNAQRADHKMANRQAAGGKKY